MAKEQDDNGLSVKMKFILWAVGLIFAAGMTYTTISSNTEGIKENRTNITGVKNEVVAVQRGQDRIGFDIRTIQKDIAEQKTESITKRNEDRDFQKEQRTITGQILQELARWEAVKDGQSP